MPIVGIYKEIFFFFLVLGTTFPRLGNLTNFEMGECIMADSMEESHGPDVKW